MNDVQDWASDNATWLWIALGVLVALAILGLLLGMWRRKKREMDRKHAAQIRREADSHAVKIEAKDAETRRIEAEAEQARAEADRLQAIAAEKRTHVEGEREVYVERMQEADKLDKGHGRDDGQDPNYRGTHSRDS